MNVEVMGDGHVISLGRRFERKVAGQEVTSKLFYTNTTSRSSYHRQRPPWRPT